MEVQAIREGIDLRASRRCSIALSISPRLVGGDASERACSASLESRSVSRALDRALRRERGFDGGDDVDILKGFSR